MNLTSLYENQISSCKPKPALAVNTILKQTGAIKMRYCQLPVVLEELIDQVSLGCQAEADEIADMKAHILQLINRDEEGLKKAYIAFEELIRQLKNAS